MIQIHATRKLFEKLPLTSTGQFAVTPATQWLFEQTALDTNPLSGWHGNLISLQRRNTLLLVHDATRFPLVLPALTKPDWQELNDRFADALMNTLLKCGATEAQMEAAQQALRPLQVDTDCSRSVQGTLNRMKGDIEHLLWYDQANIAELSGYRLGAWLADRPCNVKDRGCVWPQKEMLALLSRMANADGHGDLTTGENRACLVQGQTTRKRTL